MQREIAEREMETFRHLLGLGQRQIERAEELQQPAIDIARAVLSGDESTIARLIAPAVSGISSQMRQARESVFATVPTGAAREYALAQVAREAPTYVSQLIGETWRSAPQVLSGIGSMFGNLGLSEQRLGMTAGAEARAAISDLLRAEQSRALSWMSILGSLLGALGMSSVGWFGRKRETAGENPWQII